MKTMYVVEYACDGKRFGMYETKEDAQKAVLANVEEAPEMKRSIFDFTLKEQTTSWKDIKTFDDACAALGYDNPLVEGYYDALSMASDGVESAFIGLLGADTLAYIKLRIITAAINEGWEPKFTEDEWRYYPWFNLFTEEEYSRFSEEKKQRCVLRACGNANAGGGLVYAYAYDASAVSDTVVGVRLAFESEEKAKHAGVYFKELWADFCFREAEKK
jgi:hypothetical protein